LGNICRSSAAEEIFRRKAAAKGLSRRFVIDSAGTYGGHTGDLPDPRMRAAGAARGYDFRHLSRKVRDDDFYRYGMILAMDDSVYESLSRLAPDAESVGRIYRMADFLPRSFGYDYIPDPYYEGADGFELVLDMLDASCNCLLDTILRQNRQ